MRLKKKELSTVEVFEGVITLDDIKKKFNLPANAELTIETPFIDYDVRAYTFSFADHDLKIDVKMERVK